MQDILQIMVWLHILLAILPLAGESQCYGNFQFMMEKTQMVLYFIKGLIMEMVIINKFGS